jgi:hypothetical protein
MEWLIHDDPRAKWARGAVFGLLGGIACTSFVPDRISHLAIVAYLVLLHLSLRRPPARHVGPSSLP